MKGKQRNPNEVLKDRAQILHLVLECPGQDTRGIALTYASPQVRSTSQTRADLRFLEKIGLVSSQKLGSVTIWSTVKLGVQHSFFGSFVVVPSGNGRKRNDKSNGKIPPVRELRQQIILLTEHDFRNAWWVGKSKKEFLCDLETAGGRVSWQEADEALHHWRGGWKPAQQKLLQGRGSITTWDCGCRRIIPWVGKTTWFDCPKGGACERAVAYDRACGKKNGHKDNGFRLFEQTSTIQVQLQTRRPLNSKTPISIESCWRVDLHPPRTLNIGEFYQASCGCQFHMSQSIDGDLIGAIRADRGLVCITHEEEVAVSQE